MSDHLMRGVRVQLTTTMDTVLKTAVFEVMRILESALYGHKMEMAQRGEEIAHLKLKLQTAELKLKDFEMSHRSLQERDITKTQTDPKVVPDDPGQSNTVPEIDVDVPDDWCAPLGYDTPTKKEEGFCPSVRLRQFSIRLHPVPLVEQEVNNRDTNVEKPPAGRRSKRISTMNQKAKQSSDKNSPPVVIRAGLRPNLSGDLNRLLGQLNDNYCNLQGLDRLRKRKTSEGKASDNDRKEKEGEETSKREEENQSRIKHVCESCYRVFYTIQALYSHMRSQKKCRGCSLAFCSEVAAKNHVRVCPKYKEWKESGRSKMTRDKKNALNGSKTRVIKKTESMQSSADVRKLFTQKYICKRCNYKTTFIKKFQKHMLIHNEEVVTCNICLKKFKRRAIALHIVKKHRNVVQLGHKR